MNAEKAIRISKASKWLRLLNLIIDRLVVISSFFVFGATIMILYQITGVEIFNNIINSMDNVSKLMDILITNSVYIAYLFCMEYFVKGRTVGKFITGTRAISNTGENISAEQAFLRTVSRFVPFEAFSFLGENGWHDKWTNTNVVVNKKYNEEKLRENEINTIGLKEVI